MSLTCPYCDHEMEDPDELGQEYEHEWECSKCGKKFMFSVDYDPVYSEWKAPCLNDEGEHDFPPDDGRKIVRLCRVCGEREKARG